MTPDELTARYFLARILWWRSDLETLDADAVAQLVKVLKSVKRDIADRLLAEAAGLTSITNWNRERLKEVDAWADEVLAGATASILGTITVSSVAAATASLATYNAILSFEGRAKAVRTVGMTTEQIRSWFQDTPLGGGTLAGWVDKAFSNGVKDSLLTTLQKAGIEGKGTAATVKRVLQTALDEGFLITQREAITLTRTYIQTANVGAMEAVYQKNSGIIKEVEWCATLDNKTCRLCAVLDGRRWKMGAEHPPIPRHGRCRCVLLPRAKSWRDFGINVPDLEAVARPWVLREPGPIGAGGRKIVYAGTTKENFPGWWKTLPYEQQIQSIGAVRTTLIRDGGLTWDALVNPRTGRYYTLKELGFTERGERL